MSSENSNATDSFVWLFADVFLVGLFIDTIFSWFTPKWRRRSRMVYKGAKRFLNYRRDLLTDEKIEELENGIRTLRHALFRFNKEESVKAAGRLEHYVDSTPGPSSRNVIAENVEVFFVILVIFLGFRAYIVQPFRIPTGSMQPSLNGIRILPYDEEPSFLAKVSDKITYGSSYIDEKATNYKTISKYKQGVWLLLLTRTTVVFDDGSTMHIPCAQGEVMRYFNQKKGTPYASFAPGETIIKGRIDAGDMILVNKMAYHFRKPELGETFVFDTRGIEGIKARSSSDQAGGTHYVKRLCGLPGSSITIDKPFLLIDGKRPDSWTIKRVTDRQPPYNDEGYMPAVERPTQRPLPLYLGEGQTLRLVKNSKTPALSQYCALGDNTDNSLDSRYWGPVNQYNIIGPASFALWPFTSHWGRIP